MSTKKSTTKKAKAEKKKKEDPPWDACEHQWRSFYGGRTAKGRLRRLKECRICEKQIQVLL